MTGRRWTVALIAPMIAWGSAAQAQDPAGGTARPPSVGAPSGDPADPAASGTPDGTRPPSVATPADALEAAEAAARDAAAYGRELRTVEQGVTHAKERVFRSKATLQLLKELILDSTSAGSRLTISHDNEFSGAYTLESVQYYLDGKTILSRGGEGGALDTEREFQVAQLAIPPGKHALEVSMVVRGRGFGVFSYLRKYSFRVQSSYSVDIQPGQSVDLLVVADDKGGLFRSFSERPTIEYKVSTDRIDDSATDAPADAPAGAEGTP